MEQNKKSKIKFNVIDFIIVVVILGCLVGVFMRYNLADKIGGNQAESKAEISFMIEKISITSEDALVAGDAFYWKQNGALVGYLKDHQTTAAETYYADEEGLPKPAYSQTHINVVGVLSATGTFTDDGAFMLAGNQFIAPGKEMEVKSPHIEVTIMITDIQQIG